MFDLQHATAAMSWPSKYNAAARGAGACLDHVICFMLVTTGGRDDEQEDDSARQLHRDSSFGPDGAIFLLTCCFSVQVGRRFNKIRRTKR
jgi:hypothetical protein